MSTCYRVTVPVEGRHGKTPLPPGRRDVPAAGRRQERLHHQAGFPVGATELVLFEPKDAPDDGE